MWPRGGAAAQLPNPLGYTPPPTPPRREILGRGQGGGWGWGLGRGVGSIRESVSIVQIRHVQSGQILHTGLQGPPEGRKETKSLLELCPKVPPPLLMPCPLMPCPPSLPFRRRPLTPTLTKGCWGWAPAPTFLPPVVAPPLRAFFPRASFFIPFSAYRSFVLSLGLAHCCGGATASHSRRPDPDPPFAPPRPPSL